MAKQKALKLSDLREEKLLLLGEVDCLRKQALEVCQRTKAGGSVMI